MSQVITSPKRETSGVQLSHSRHFCNMLIHVFVVPATSNREQYFWRARPERPAVAPECKVTCLP